MNWLNSILSKNEKLAVGLISGTSMDGIDAALLRISGFGQDTNIEIVDFLCEQYTEESKKSLEDIENEFSIQRLSDLNFIIGKEFSDAALKIIKKNGLESSQIDFIGSHGQTVFHNPPSLNNDYSSTIQIGEIDVICEETGITTIGDFRTKDLASGGEAAPFIPYFDFVCFSKLEKNVVAQNIGGIANCTLVTSDWNDLIAYDSGPGNSLMDSIIFLATDGEKKFDSKGELASKGSVNNKLLEKLLKNSYFNLPPPKSTGKELFGMNLAKDIFELSHKEGINLNDLLCTLVELTSETIALSYERFIFPHYKVEEVILSGGGSHNTFLVERIKNRLENIEIVFSDKYGIPVDAKEAAGFTIFANETLYGNSTNISKITGAKNKNILGKISIGRNQI